MKKLLPFVMLALTFVILILGTLHTRLYEIDGQLMSASYINLPGFEEHGYQEDTVDLTPWLGSNIKDLTVTVDGVKNAELEAAMTLKAIGAFGPEYETKPVGDHWVLFRPAKSWTEFTWTAHYRVSPFSPAK